MLTVFTWGGFILASHVRTPGLIVIVAVQPLVLVFGVYFAGLFKYPAVSIGVVGWLVRGAMNLARALHYAVQVGRFLIISFEWLFPLIGFIASESGINCRILNIVTVNAALLLVATRPATTVPGIRITRVLGHIVATSKPAVLPRTKAGHECREGCHRFRLFLS